MAAQRQAPARGQQPAQRQGQRANGADAARRQPPARRQGVPARRPRRVREKPYRHELKYYLNYRDYLLLREKLSQVMEHDPHAARSGGEYHIRSLYFDSLSDAALREKLAGVDDRDKFRIRIYNLSDKVIKLECKHKLGGYIQKQSLPLSREEAEALMAGSYAFLLHKEDRFARRMFTEFAVQGLRPVVLVDYMREPFVYPLQDVRITFDRDIRTAFRATSLFDAGLPTYPVIEGYDMVMEVKFNEYLPGHIRELLQIDASLRSAVSKYCICRKFEL